MEIIRKIGYSIVIIMVTLLLLTKLVIPALGLWIILTPIIFAAIVSLVGFFLGAFYELLKIIVKILSIALFFYVLMKIFIWYDNEKKDHSGSVADPDRYQLYTINIDICEVKLA